MSMFSSVGVIAGPYVVGLTGDASERLGLDPIAAPWYVAAGIVAVAAWAMATLSPEPLDVARNPERYHGDEAVQSSQSEEPTSSAPARPLRQLLRLYPIVAAVGMTFFAQGVRMSIVPLLSSVLRARGYSLTLGATMVAAMGFGMIAASLPSGRLGDSRGRKRVLIPATLIAMICAVLVPLTSSLAVMFVALVVLGMAFVAILNMTRSMMADVSLAMERGTIFSVSFIAVGISVVIFPTVASYVRSSWGWSGIAGLSGILLCIVLAFVIFLREPEVGRWDHAGVE
jgi:MFS family permease